MGEGLKDELGGSILLVCRTRDASRLASHSRRIGDNRRHLQGCLGRLNIGLETTTVRHDLPNSMGEDIVNSVGALANARRDWTRGVPPQGDIDNGAEGLGIAFPSGLCRFSISRLVSLTNQ